MHPSLRRRMLAPLTKRTKQSTLFECDEEWSAIEGELPHLDLKSKFECDEEWSAINNTCSYPINLTSLNAMKSGVQCVLCGASLDMGLV